MDIGLWGGLLASAGTPRAAVDRLNVEGGNILPAQDCREKGAVQGLEVVALTPEQYADRFQTPPD